MQICINASVWWVSRPHNMLFKLNNVNNVVQSTDFAFRVNCLHALVDNYFLNRRYELFFYTTIQ